MQQLYMITYRLREDLDEEDLRELTQLFAEIGNIPGTIAHHARLDGRGGFLLQDAAADPPVGFEATLRYTPWMEFEIVPVATMEEAFPVIQRIYG